MTQTESIRAITVCDEYPITVVSQEIRQYGLYENLKKDQISWTLDHSRLHFIGTTFFKF